MGLVVAGEDGAGGCVMLERCGCAGSERVSAGSEGWKWQPAASGGRAVPRNSGGGLDDGKEWTRRAGLSNGAEPKEDMRRV